MEQIVIQKNFATRKEFDAYVLANFGSDPEKNRDIVFEADDDTLKALSLSEKTTVHGVRVRKAS